MKKFLIFVWLITVILVILTLIYERVGVVLVSLLIPAIIITFIFLFIESNNLGTPGEEKLPTFYDGTVIDKVKEAVGYKGGYYSFDLATIGSSDIKYKYKIIIKDLNGLISIIVVDEVDFYSFEIGDTVRHNNKKIYKIK